MITNETRAKTLERFFKGFDWRGDSECWPWIKHVNRQTGYGTFSYEGVSRLAHRMSYELLAGEIPPGLTIDHLCRVRKCVNPAHLEPVTLAENARRAAVVVSHCKHGHEYTPENTITRRNGSRCCRACEQRRDRERYQRDEKRRHWRQYRGIA